MQTNTENSTAIDSMWRNTLEQMRISNKIENRVAYIAFSLHFALLHIRIFAKNDYTRQASSK